MGNRKTLRKVWDKTKQRKVRIHKHGEKITAMSRRLFVDSVFTIFLGTLGTC